MERNQARETLQTLLQGNSESAAPSLQAAKARLRAADPGIDISRPLARLNRGEVHRAATDLAAEVVAGVTLPYLRPLFTPLLVGLIEVFVGSGQREKTKKLPRGER